MDKINYFVNRQERTAHAKEWVKYINSQLSEDIHNSMYASVIYNEDEKMEDVTPNLIKVYNSDSVSALFNYYSYPGRVCVLNFASFKNPGGKFYEGSSAQEESLCHSSTLYPVLKGFEDVYYKQNEKSLNKGLYKNRAIYSPNITFVNDKNREMCADVITCAAPNKAAAQKYQNVSDAENSEVLRSRIRYVLDIAEKNRVDVLILGAYGCGVFGQDPREVAEIFKEELEGRNFDEVVFPIPGGDNLKAFQEVLDN